MKYPINLMMLTMYMGKCWLLFGKRIIEFEKISLNNSNKNLLNSKDS